LPGAATGLTFGVGLAMGGAMFTGTSAAATAGSFAVAGAVSGAAGDAASQLVSLNLGWQKEYNLGQTLGAAIGGGIAGGIAGSYFRTISTAQGLQRVMKSGTTLRQQLTTEILGGGAGGATGNSITQGYELLTGQRRSFNVGEMIHAAVQGAGSGLTAWGIHRAATNFRTACFAGETKIYARGLWGCGWRRIDLITVDDEVLSRDENDPHGALVWKKVEEVFVRTAQVYILHLGGRVIGTTLEHPFYADGKGWTATAELACGDRIPGMDPKETVAVEGVADSGDHRTVYNLRVADYHTYFVGCEEWGFSVWAHNADYETRLQNAAREKAEALLRKAAANEPEITATLKGVAGKVPAELVGLDNRLKGVDSLARKLADLSRPKF